MSIPWSEKTLEQRVVFDLDWVTNRIKRSIEFVKIIDHKGIEEKEGIKIREMKTMQSMLEALLK